jgi:hypothetical protein
MTKYDEPAMALCETVSIRGGYVLHLAERGSARTTCGSPVYRRTWFARRPQPKFRTDILFDDAG